MTENNFYYFSMTVTSYSENCRKVLFFKFNFKFFIWPYYKNYNKLSVENHFFIMFDFPRIFNIFSTVYIRLHKYSSGTFKIFDLSFFSPPDILTINFIIIYNVIIFDLFFFYVSTILCNIIMLYRTRNSIWEINR